MREKTINADFCVVGGGMAGLCAAIAAARKGCKTVLVQDRAVLGGNASSEIRMWICGAHGENNHETGILEEILLDNIHRNRYPVYSIWDSVLYEKARFQENLELLLNTYIDSCVVDDAAGAAGTTTVVAGAGANTGSGAATAGRKIRSVSGNQMTTETRVTINAPLFADCSGDGMLGAMSGAQYRMGREARGEFNESIAPEQADQRTMGLSCLIQARETERPQPFIAPSWAYKYADDGTLPNRNHTLTGSQNFWWLEVGGMQDTVHDKEDLRDELLKIAFGIWDHIKNRGEHGADNWALDWVGFLPGKRESRRFVGDHILTQNDVEAAGRDFSDNVAYGGWTMDDHFPEGFYKKEAGTIFHPAPSPYGIPYRSLYSCNVENLFFAGRNISATHTALSSTRVMATCAVIGQAVGTAAALCVTHATGAGPLSPRQVYQKHIAELQQALMTDDCYIPFRLRAIGPLTAAATLSATAGDPEPVRNGYDRQIGDARNSWDAGIGNSITFAFDRPTTVGALRLVFDSDLSRTTHNMLSYYTLAPQDFVVPPQLVRSFTVETRAADGSWSPAYVVTDNHQRLVRLPLAVETTAVRVTATATWGADVVRVFAIDLE